MNKLVALAGLIFSAAFSQLSPAPIPRAWSSAGVGEVRLLYRDYQDKTGHALTAMSQGQAPSCVGCAAAKALEVMHGIPFSAEWIYATSRSVGNVKGGAGSYCGWAAHAAANIGVLPAADYSVLGEDFSTYSADRANAYGIRGPPVDLLPIAALYKSPGYHQISSWDEFRGAISSGIPVIIGSDVSFGARHGQVKNRDGSLARRWWGRWRHAMVFIGVDDRDGSQGALLMNSWGDDWVSGPKRFEDEPDGCFWANKSAVQRMISQGDCFVILPITGL